MKNRQKLFKIKFGNKKRVSTFAVPKRGKKIKKNRKRFPGIRQEKLTAVKRRKTYKNRSREAKEKVLLGNRKSCSERAKILTQDFSTA